MNDLGSYLEVPKKYSIFVKTRFMLIYGYDNNKGRGFKEIKSNQEG